MQAQNIIFTGVAGTGKTYRLQQLAKEYTEVIEPVNQEQVLGLLLKPLRWCDVVCLIFLEKKQQGCELLKTSEIAQHAFFQKKMQLNQRNDNVTSASWKILKEYSSPNSTTVTSTNRVSTPYFDKDKGDNWYLLDSALPLLTDLQNQLDDYLHGKSLASKIERFAMVSFHQAYGYDEFVEGIRPVIDESTGQMRYRIESGIFLELCKEARNNPQHRYAMLIDEINRANVTQVFGELMSLIEPSKRLGSGDEMSVRLAYSKTVFAIPSNIDIYATMNTQDYSLVSLDSAFRRRFQFVEMLPNSEGLGQVTDINGQVIKLGKLLNGLNQRICQYLGEQYQLGQAYFYPVQDIQQLLTVMVQQVLPQLISHTTHQPQALNEILQLTKTPWLIYHSAQNHYQLNPQLLSLVNHQTVTDNAFLNAKMFEGLYE